MKSNLKGYYPSRHVYLNGKWLDPKPSQKHRNHSPDGFNWGYGGSGPAQLALAVFLEVYGTPRPDHDFYQDFKVREIAGIPQGKDFDINIEL